MTLSPTSPNMLRLQTIVASLVFLGASWISVRAYLHLYYFGVERRRSVLFIGLFFLVLGVSGGWFFEVEPKFLSAIGVSSQTSTLLKIFFSVGVAAMAGNFLVSAVLLPTKEQERKRDAELALRIAETLRRDGL